MTKEINILVSNLLPLKEYLFPLTYASRMPSMLLLYTIIALDKRCVQISIFLVSPQKHTFWVL